MIFADIVSCTSRQFRFPWSIAIVALAHRVAALPHPIVQVALTHSVQVVQVAQAGSLQAVLRVAQAGSPVQAVRVGTIQAQAHRSIS